MEGCKKGNIWSFTKPPGPGLFFSSPIFLFVRKYFLPIFILKFDQYICIAKLILHFVRLRSHYLKSIHLKAILIRKCQKCASFPKQPSGAAFHEIAIGNYLMWYCYRSGFSRSGCGHFCDNGYHGSVPVLAWVQLPLYRGAILPGVQFTHFTK